VGWYPFIYNPRNLLQLTLVQSVTCSNCKSNHVVINQISTLSNQIFFSLKSNRRTWFNHDLNQLTICLAHHWPGDTCGRHRSTWRWPRTRTEWWTGATGRTLRRNSPHIRPVEHKKLSYRRGTARCVMSVEVLPVATQQCRNYLYDKSWTKYQLSMRQNRAVDSAWRSVR